MARFNNFSWKETLLTLWKIYYGGSFDGAGYEKAVIKHGGNTGERCKLRAFYNNITSSKYFFSKVKGAKRKQNATDNVKKIILERGQRCSRKLL